MQCMDANLNRDREKKPEPYTLQEFAPYLDQVPPMIDLGPEENERLIMAQMDSCAGIR